MPDVLWFLNIYTKDLCVYVLGLMCIKYSLLDEKGEILLFTKKAVGVNTYSILHSVQCNFNPTRCACTAIVKSFKFNRVHQRSGYPDNITKWFLIFLDYKCLFSVRCYKMDVQKLFCFGTFPPILFSVNVILNSLASNLALSLLIQAMTKRSCTCILSRLRNLQTAVERCVK
jgi:hypothetical protein